MCDLSTIHPPSLWLRYAYHRPWYFFFSVILPRQLICAPCHSYSGHLYARLLPSLLLGDGLTMTKDFCNGLVTECTGQGTIEFPTYMDPDEGELDYCQRHAGTQPGDFYWSYPYTEGEV